MMKSKVVFFIIFLFLASALVSALPVKSNNGVKRGSTFPLIGHSNNAWVRKYNGHQIMLVRGTHYEMGYQHGAMLAEEAAETIRAYLSSVGESESELLQVYNRGAPYIPQDYKDEMQGLADASGISIDDVHAAHAIPTLHHCSGFAVWGNATTDGKVYHTRSLDYGVTIADPDTGVTIQNNSVVIFREPNDGYTNVVPSWAGFIGSVDGMNEKKISIGEMGQGTNDSTQYGLFMIFRLRYVLEHSSTLDEAVKLMGINRTYGYSFIVADGNINQAKVLEMTWHRYYNGTWNDPQESNGYNVEQYPIEDAVRRGNHLVAYQTALTSRDVYFMLPTDGDFIHFANYYDLGRRIEQNYGNIDFHKAQEIFTDAYRMYPMQMTLHHVIFDPADLRLMVADAYPEGTSAFWNTYYEYSMPAILSMPDIVNITNPTNGSTISGKITITPSYLYTPNLVKLYVDGVEINSTSSAPYTFNWDSSSVSNGAHVLEIRAYGSNYSAISYITVYVSNKKQSNGIANLSIKHHNLDIIPQKPITLEDMITHLSYPKITVDSPKGSSDWVITNTTYLNDTVKVVNGNVSINNASLILNHSTLIINTSYDGQYGIILSNHASLILTNSSKIENKTARFYIYADSTTKNIVIKDSQISGGGERAEHPLLYTEGGNITIVNSTFIHSSYGVIINGKNTLRNVTVINSTFYIENSEHYPMSSLFTPRGVSLMLGNTENATVSGVKVYGIGNGKLLSFGVLLTSSKYAHVRDIYVEHEYIGFGIMNSEGNTVDNITVEYCNIGNGLLFSAQGNTIMNYRFQHGAGAIADVFNAPQNTFKDVYVNDTSIALGADESNNVTLENVTILNSAGGAIFKSAQNLTVRNITMDTLLAGVILAKDCGGSIIDGANITLGRDMFGVGIKNSPNSRIENVVVHGARYALHIEGETLDDYNITVNNFTSDSGAVKYYYGSMPATVSGAEVYIVNVANKKIDATSIDAPIYLAMAHNVSLNVSMENVVNGVNVYHSSDVWIKGTVKNSSTYGFLGYDITNTTVDLEVNGACWGYAVHYGHNVYVHGNATNLKDAAIYAYNSNSKFDINATESKYGVISSYSQIYVTKSMPVAQYYYHVYNSTVYLANWLHVEVLDSSNAPIQGATVNVSFNGKLIVSKQTDANGRVDEIVPYALWTPESTHTNYTVIEVKYDGLSFDANPREVDMSSERTEIFKESVVPELNTGFIAMIAVLLAITAVAVRRRN